MPSSRAALEAMQGQLVRDQEEIGTHRQALLSKIGGAIQTPERANKIWKQILNEFEAPPMDAAIREELEAFVVRRKEEGGAPTDF